MNAKVIQAISFLLTCTTGELKKKLRETPASFDVSFSADSKEYKCIVEALRKNTNDSHCARNPIYFPTAIKFANLF